MNQQISQGIDETLKTANNAENLNAQELNALLGPYFSTFKTSHRATLEAIKVSIGKGQSATIAVSSKLANLRFRLKDVVLQLAKTGVELAGAKENPLALILAVISFLQAAGKLQQYTLSNQEALVLYEIGRLTIEKEPVTQEALVQLLQGKLEEPQVVESLNLLSRIACIHYVEDHWELIETILFVKAG